MFKEAVEQELKNITEGGDDVKRRLSRSWSRQVPASLASRKKWVGDPD